jgi:hypothetical protein
MFAAAATFLESDFPDLTVEDTFTALFCIMFSAQQMGTTMSLGPDVAKATLAAERIFTIKNKKSLIDAQSMDQDENGDEKFTG